VQNIVKVNVSDFFFIFVGWMVLFFFLFLINQKEKDRIKI
jgi:preprotein translocase subunit YajC